MVIVVFITTTGQVMKKPWDVEGRGGFGGGGGDGVGRGVRRGGVAAAEDVNEDDLIVHEAHAACFLPAKCHGLIFSFNVVGKFHCSTLLLSPFL